MGAGLSYGCDWRVGRHWRIGISTGLSWVRLDYNRYNCGSCGIRNGHYIKNLVSITDVVVTLSYIIS